MRLDLTPLLEGLDLYIAAVRRGVVEGVGAASLQLLTDSIMQTPTVPLKWGITRNSGSVFVNSKLVTTSEGIAAQYLQPDRPPNLNPKPNKTFRMPKSKTMVRGVVGFNTHYASWLHEGLDITFSEPGSGAKYLEYKLANNARTYMQIVVEHIRKQLKKERGVRAARKALKGKTRAIHAAATRMD